MIEDKITEGTVTISKLGVYLSARTEQGFSLDFRYATLPELKTIGISNICEDQKFVLFLDYDDINKEDLDKQLEMIFKVYNVSHFFILTTGKHKYHVISLDKFKLRELRDLMNNTMCDYSYKNMPIKLDKGWILRLYPKLDRDGNIIKSKPEYVTFMSTSITGSREISRAHLELLGKIYSGINSQNKNNDIFNEGMLDDYHKVKVIKYGTSAKNLISNFDLDDLIKAKRISIEWIEEEEEKHD